MWVFVPIGTLAIAEEYPDKSPLVVFGLAAGVAHSNPVASPLAAVRTFPFDPTANRARSLEFLDNKSPLVFKTSPATVAAFFNVDRKVIIYYPLNQ